MKRKYRDRESGESITIIIPVIICLIARARAKQYTKRLLPNSLTSHTVIRLDHLLGAANLPETARTEAAVCDLLGCLDPRTTRYQMRRLTPAIQAVSLELARRRAAIHELGELPERSPETPSGERLVILFEGLPIPGFLNTGLNRPFESSQSHVLSRATISVTTELRRDPVDGLWVVVGDHGIDVVYVM